MSVWINIARTGTFLDSAGQAHTFDVRDLDALVENYNPERSEAPLVFGHPRDDAPAYGWVRALRREGSILRAQLAYVPEKIRALVAEGRYRYVSMSVSADKKQLRHIGLLGAVPPAIDGLGAVCLAASQGNIHIPFSRGDVTALTGTENKKRMVKTMSEQETETWDEDAQKAGQQDEHTESTAEEHLSLHEQLRMLVAELEALRLQNNQLQTQCGLLVQAREAAEHLGQDAARDFEAYKTQIYAQTREARINALVSSGRLEPSRKDETCAFAAALAAVQIPVSFASATGEYSEKQGLMSAEEHYFQELEARPVAALLQNFAAPAPAHLGRTGNWANMTGKL